MKKEVEVLVRAIIQIKGKFLVCKKLKKKYFFFPGGHLEFGESAKKALVREIKEELGIIIKKSSFIGGSEHTFVEDGIKHHEINLAFQVPIKKINLKSKENHLKFYLINKTKMKKQIILPVILRNAILKWLKNKTPFWVSQI